MGERLNISDGNRNGEIRKDGELLGRFDASDSSLSPEELETIRKALAEDQDAVIKAAKESRLGLKSLVFRDFRKASEGAVSRYGKSMDEVQKALNQETSVTPKVSVDGDYGPDTFAAAVQFQKAKGIHVDGVIGPETLEALFEGTQAKVPQTYEAPGEEDPAEGSTDDQEVTTARLRSPERSDYTTRVEKLESGLHIVPANHPLLTGTRMVEMVHLYEGSGKRHADGKGYFDIGGGVNTGSERSEIMFALGENFNQWFSSKIPTDRVEEVIGRMLQARVATAYETCEALGVNFDHLPTFAQVVITDMHYNLKPNSIGEFKKFWAAVKDENWNEAALQLIDHGNGGPSGYLEDTYVRAYANARILMSHDHTRYEEFRKEGESLIRGKKTKDDKTRALFVGITERLKNPRQEEHFPPTSKRTGPSGGILAGILGKFGLRRNNPDVPMVQPASMSRPETRETTPVLERHISLDEAYALMRESNPQTHTPDGKLIVYRVDLKPGEKSDRYLENTDPAHQGPLETRNLGPRGKLYVAIHKTAAGWDGDRGESLSDTEVDRESFNAMISSGLFPYLITQRGLVIQGADDMTTGGSVNTHIANPNMNKRGGYDNFNNQGIAIEFALRGYPHGTGKYGAYESINERQARSGRDFIAFLQSKHNIAPGRVITSADPVRTGPDSFVEGAHGDDFDDNEAELLGLDDQRSRLVLLDSRRFFDEEAQPQSTVGQETMVAGRGLEIESGVPDSIASTARDVFENELGGKGTLKISRDPSNGSRPVVVYIPEGFSSGGNVVFHLHGRSGENFSGKASGGSADKWLTDAIVSSQKNGSMLIYPISGGKRTDKPYDEKWFQTAHENAGEVLASALSDAGIDRDRVQVVAQGHSAGGRILPGVIRSIEPQHVVMLDATYASWGEQVYSAIGSTATKPKLTVVVGGDAKSTGEGAQTLRGKDGVEYIDASQVAHTDMNARYFLGFNQSQLDRGLRGDLDGNLDSASAQKLFLATMQNVESNDGTARIKSQIDRLSPQQRTDYGHYLTTKFSDSHVPQNKEELCAFQQFCYIAGAPIKYIDATVGDETKSFYYVAVLESSILDKLPMLEGEYTEENAKAHSDKIKQGLDRLTTIEKEALVYVRSKLLPIVREDMSQEDLQLYQSGEYLAGNTNIIIDGNWGPEMMAMAHVPEKSEVDHEMAYKRLSQQFQIYSTGAGFSEDGSDRGTNRTSLVDLQGYTLNGAIELAQAVGAKPGELIITGGTEKGHSGTGEGTHYGGSKLDLRVDDKLVAFTGLTGMNQRVTKYINGRQVDFLRHGPNDHFDVRFYPRIEASVQGDYMMAQSQTKNETYVASADEYIRANSVPEKWQGIVTDFFRRLPANERISTDTPLAVASKRSRKGIFISRQGTFEYPIILGTNGTSPGQLRSGSKRTATDLPVRFTFAKLAKSFDGDASNSGSRTVKGASLQGPELEAAGGQWWHGVADYRLKSGATWGCVGMPIAEARKAATIINENGGGWGYVSEGLTI